jgi:hypothetical protein
VASDCSSRRRPLPSAAAALVLGAVGLVCAALTEAPRWPRWRTGPMLAAGLVAGAVFGGPHPSPPGSSGHASAVFGAHIPGGRGRARRLLHRLCRDALGDDVVAHRAVALLGPARCREHRARSHHGGDPFTILRPAVSRFGVQGTVAVGAVSFAGAGGWLLANTGYNRTYATVVLPAMLLWGVANALIQPSLFACADAAPRADLASGSAVLATARQFGGDHSGHHGCRGPGHWSPGCRYPRGCGGQYRDS